MISRTISLEELSAVLSHYALGSLSAPPQAGGGTANANVTLETPEGKLFLKRRNPKYASLEYVAFDHRLMEYLAPFQLGTPLAQRTLEGDRWLLWQEQVYELYPFQEGEERDSLSFAELASTGECLAQFHTASRQFPPTTGKNWQRYHAPAPIRTGIKAIHAELRQRLSPSDLHFLEEQLCLLENDFPDTRYHALPKVIVHGDYHPGNLKFQGEQVSGVFDLDWATLQPRVLDIADGVFLLAGERLSPLDATNIVSLTQTWNPSQSRTLCFLQAYLQTEPLSLEEWEVLDLAVRTRWLSCRLSGMAKLPEGERIDYFLEGLLEPLRTLHTLAPLFKSLR